MRAFNFFGGSSGVEAMVPSRVDLGDEKAVSVACSAALTSVVTGTGLSFHESLAHS
jgi:hypothetical protein